jgi:hypothetical protein
MSAPPFTREPYVLRSNRNTTVSKFQADMRAAQTDAVTIRTYDRVYITAIHWENDNLGVVPLEKKLLNVLRSDYGFECFSFTTPTSGPEHDLHLYHGGAWGSLGGGFALL